MERDDCVIVLFATQQQLDSVCMYHISFLIYLLDYWILPHSLPRTIQWYCLVVHEIHPGLLIDESASAENMSGWMIAQLRQNKSVTSLVKLGGHAAVFFLSSFLQKS